jgi:hypothetical protein
LARPQGAAAPSLTWRRRVLEQPQVSIDFIIVRPYHYGVFIVWQESKNMEKMIGFDKETGK